jgi:hypothetical protein
VRVNANPIRDLVEAGGNPFIRLEFGEDDTVHVQASGVPEQNIMPILSRIVKAWAQQDLPE